MSIRLNPKAKEFVPANSPLPAGHSPTRPAPASVQTFSYSTALSPEEEALRKEEKIDGDGNLLPLKKPLNLRNLDSDQTVQRIQEIVSQPVKVALPTLNVELHIPADKLIACVRDHLADVPIEAFLLIGGSASYVLEDTLNALLEEVSPAVFSKNNRLKVAKPADRDLRIAISPKYMSKCFTLEEAILSHVLLPHLLQAVPDINPIEAKQILKNQGGFTKRSLVNLKQNEAGPNKPRYAILTIGDLDISLGIQYARTHLFERDYPQVDLLPFFDSKTVALATKDPHKLAQAALDRKIKRIHVLQPEQLGDKKFLDVISLISQGYAPPDAHFVDSLKAKFLNYCNDSPVYHLSQYLFSHYPTDPLGALRMKFFFFFALRDKFSEKDIESMWEQTAYSKEKDRSGKEGFSLWKAVKTSFDAKQKSSGGAYCLVPQLGPLWVHAMALQGVPGNHLRPEKPLETFSHLQTSDVNEALSIKFNAFFQFGDAYSDDELYALWMRSPLSSSLQKIYIHPLLDELNRAIQNGEMSIKECKNNLALIACLAGRHEVNAHAELKLEKTQEHTLLQLDPQTALRLPLLPNKEEVNFGCKASLGGTVPENMFRELFAAPLKPTQKLDSSFKEFGDKLRTTYPSRLLDLLRIAVGIDNSEFWKELLKALLEKDYPKLAYFKKNTPLPIEEWKKIGDRKKLLQTVLSSLASTDLKEAKALFHSLPEQDRSNELFKHLFTKIAAQGIAPCLQTIADFPEYQTDGELLKIALAAIGSKALSDEQWDLLKTWSPAVKAEVKEMGDFILAHQNEPTALTLLISCTKSGLLNPNSPKTIEIWRAFCDSALQKQGTLPSWDLFQKLLQINPIPGAGLKDYPFLLAKKCLQDGHKQIYQNLLPHLKKINPQQIAELKQLELKEKGEDLSLSEFDQAYPPSKSNEMLVKILRKQISGDAWQEAANYLLSKNDQLSRDIVEEFFPSVFCRAAQEQGAGPLFISLCRAKKLWEHISKPEKLLEKAIGATCLDQLTLLEEIALILPNSKTTSSAILKAFAEAHSLPLPAGRTLSANVKNVFKKSLDAIGRELTSENPQIGVLMAHAALKHKYPFNLKPPEFASYCRAVMPSIPNFNPEEIKAIETMMSQRQEEAPDLRIALFNYYSSRREWQKAATLASIDPEHLGILPHLIENEDQRTLEALNTKFKDSSFAGQFATRYSQALLQKADRLSPEFLKFSILMLGADHAKLLLPVWTQKWDILLSPIHHSDNLTLLKTFREKRALCWQNYFSTIRTSADVESAWNLFIKMQPMEGNKSACLTEAIQALKACKSPLLHQLFSDEGERLFFFPGEEAERLQISKMAWEAACETTPQKKGNDPLLNGLWKGRERLKAKDCRSPQGDINLARLLIGSAQAEQKLDNILMLLRSNQSPPNEETLKLTVDALEKFQKTPGFAAMAEPLVDEILKKIENEGLKLHDHFVFLNIAVQYPCMNTHRAKKLFFEATQQRITKPALDFLDAVVTKETSKKQSIELYINVMNHPRFKDIPLDRRIPIITKATEFVENFEPKIERIDFIKQIKKAVFGIDENIILPDFIDSDPLLELLRKQWEIEFKSLDKTSSASYAAQLKIYRDKIQKAKQASCKPLQILAECLLNTYSDSFEDFLSTHEKKSTRFSDETIDFPPDHKTDSIRAINEINDVINFLKEFAEIFPQEKHNELLIRFWNRKLDITGRLSDDEFKKEIDDLSESLHEAQSKFQTLSEPLLDLRNKIWSKQLTHKIGTGEKSLDELDIAYEKVVKDQKRVGIKKPLLHLHNLKIVFFLKEIINCYTDNTLDYSKSRERLKKISEEIKAAIESNKDSEGEKLKVLISPTLLQFYKTSITIEIDHLNSTELKALEVNPQLSDNITHSFKEMKSDVLRNIYRQVNKQVLYFTDKDREEVIKIPAMLRLDVAKSLATDLRKIFGLK